MPDYEFQYRKPRRRRKTGRVLLLIILIIGMIAYPVYEAFDLNTEEYTTDITDLPSNLKNLKIVYVTDIHQNLWNTQARTDMIIKTINSLSADLVLFGGDYASDPESAIAFFETLPTIQSRLGVYGVLGESDRSDSTDELNALLAAMKEAGVTPLVNEVAEIRVGQTYLYIAGIDDMVNGDPDIDGVAEQISSDDIVILLAHNPDLLTDAVNATDADGSTHWFDLGLFGYTHGGQINLFGQTLIAKYIPEASTKYLSGWITENRAEILISNGAGTSDIPMRLFAPAQIHLIKLK